MTAVEIRLALLELTAAYYRRRYARLAQSDDVSEAELEEAEYQADRAELEVELFKEENDIPEGDTP